MRIRSKGFIFDLDGTLLDSLADMVDAFNKGLEQFNMPTHTEERFRAFMDEGMHRMFQLAIPEDTPEDVRKNLLTIVRNHYRDGWAIKTSPFPGVMPLLDTLIARALPMTVLSNKPHDFTRVMVEHFFPAVPFVDVRGAKPEVPAKPDPVAALEQAEMLGLAPEEICFVGDSAIDVETAHRAGMLSVGVTWGFRPERELKEAGARIIIHDPLALLRHME